MPTTGGSKALVGSMAPDDAFTVAKLRAGGAEPMTRPPSRARLVWYAAVDAMESFLPSLTLFATFVLSASSPAYPASDPVTGKLPKIKLFTTGGTIQQGLASAQAIQQRIFTESRASS